MAPWGCARPTMVLASACRLPCRSPRCSVGAGRAPRANPTPLHPPIHEATFLLMQPPAHPSTSHSFHLSIPVSTDLSTHPPICPSTHPSVHHPSTHPYVNHPSILQSVHPPTHLSIHPLICPSVHPPTHLSIHPLICPPSIHPPICPSSVHPFTHTAIVITPHSPTSCKHTTVLAGLALFFIGQSFSSLGSTHRVWGQCKGPMGSVRRGGSPSGPSAWILASPQRSGA